LRDSPLTAPRRWKHWILHTVPYESETQPIEKLWWRVKYKVAEQHTAHRNDAVLRTHAIWGLYGVPKNVSNGELVDGTKRWKHVSEEEIDSWISGQFMDSCV